MIKSILSAVLILTSSLAAATPEFPANAEITRRMQAFVDANEVAGVVTVVADREKILHLSSVGKADIDADKPMKHDTIVWIASMTKPITGVAVMMLQDEGKLSIDDPVSNYLPEFKNTKTADGKPQIITIRHLLSHTSGMADATTEESRVARTLGEIIPVCARKPLQFVPGSQWKYCQSAINTAGRIVEVVSGQSFDTFLEKRLFAPLGMKDTTFYLADVQFTRLAKPYKYDNKRLLEAANFILLGKMPTDRDRFPAANGGLFSTAPDYLRFCQMILNGGSLDGKTYLKPETVKLMTTVCTGDLKTGFTPGNGWGIGWCVVREPQGPTQVLSPGTHGHGGAFGTQAWIDPVKGRIYILMTQRSNFPNADASDLRMAFQRVVADVLK